MALNFFNIRIRKARIHISITLSDFEQYAAIYRANSQTNQNIHFEYSSKITKSQGVAEFSAFSNFLFLRVSMDAMRKFDSSSSFVWELVKIRNRRPKRTSISSFHCIIKPAGVVTRQRKLPSDRLLLRRTSIIIPASIVFPRPTSSATNQRLINKSQSLGCNLRSHATIGACNQRQNHETYLDWRTWFSLRRFCLWGLPGLTRGLPGLTKKGLWISYPQLAYFFKQWSQSKYWGRHPAR